MNETAEFGFERISKVVVLWRDDILAEIDRGINGCRNLIQIV